MNFICKTHKYIYIVVAETFKNLFNTSKYWPFMLVCYKNIVLHQILTKLNYIYNYERQFKYIPHRMKYKQTIV